MKVLNFGDHTFTASTILPPELLDLIIDHIHDDRPTLLALGLVSKQTLVRSRGHLFSKLEFTYNEHSFDTLVAKQKLAGTRYLPTKLQQFNDGDRQFDTFLSLLEAPWTTFTFAVEFLHIRDLFHVTRKYKYRPNRNIPCITARLPNLKSLWLTSIVWPWIPPTFETSSSSSISLTCSLTVSNFHRSTSSNFSPGFSHPWKRLRCITSSRTKFLISPNNLPSSTGGSASDIAVESFHLGLVSLTMRDRGLYTPFISRFLQHFGQSVHRLFINLSDPYLRLQALPYYESVDLSQCVNVRVVHIGSITLGPLSATLPVMRTLLSALPSNCVEEIVLMLRPPKREEVVQLECSFWLELVSSAQKAFQMLKRIAIRVGFWQDQDFHPCIEAWRQAGLKQLEQEGLVSLDMIPWGTTIASHGPPWREATGSLYIL